MTDRMTRAVAALDEVRQTAASADRHDLVTRLDEARARLLAPDVAVAVVGEFKQGKSTLVNALLRTEICPVDTDIVTAVPTIVRYGAEPSVVAHLDTDNGAPARLDIPLDRLAAYVTERATNEPPVRTVEVRLDRPLLRRGLSFMDTPGIGGLDSAQGNLTLGVLPVARAALFVTDAAQELSAPELEFLTRTIERCPIVVCVVTKTDLHAEWRRIVDLNHGHLSRAGISVPILPVSSFLRLRAGARGSSGLNAESGFPRLLEVLWRDVLGGAEDATLRAAQADVAFAIAQLRDRVDMEREVVSQPGSGEAVARNLAEKVRRSHNLGGGSASWQTVLADGIQDLTADVEHDLRERLRAMQRRGEALLDTGDPRDTLRDFASWASREASAAAVDNLFTLVSRTEQLAREVADRFNLEYESLDLDLPAPAVSLANVQALEVKFDRSGLRRFFGTLVAARLAVGGLMVVGALVNPLWLLIAAPPVLAAGIPVSRRLLRADRERDVEQRRQQVKHELRRYIEEVAFVVGKDSRDAVRRSQRFLRDEFTARATMIERSSAQTLAAVREAAALPDPERARRAQELETQRQHLERVTEDVHRAMGPGPMERRP
ncbi:MAG TPA: dynamin family protein [Pilimelia sp.]|nr:dynamin family protein [Pilimelia sp.]